MPNARRDGLPDLPDAEIEKYLPPGVPLKWPAEQLTSTDEALAALHRTMIVGHARMCAALDAFRDSPTTAEWNRCMAEMREVLEAKVL